MPQLCHTQHIIGPLTIQSISLYSLGDQDGHCQCVCKDPKHQKHWGLKKQLCKDASVTSAEQCEQLVKQQLSGAGRGKATAIGAATGAGVGGLATAITAFVEKNNINCRVGNGLNTVSYGKSYTIPTLRDLYLKFGLQLPDVVSPGANIAGCDAWVNACAEYLDLNMCRFAQFNYKSSDGVVAQSVPAACVVSMVCVLKIIR